MTDYTKKRAEHRAKIVADAERIAGRVSVPCDCCGAVEPILRVSGCGSQIGKRFDLCGACYEAAHDSHGLPCKTTKAKAAT